MKTVRLTGTTSSAGALTVTGGAVCGLLHAVDIDLSACDATADLTLSTQLAEGAQTILTLTDSQASAIYYPRGSSCGSTGTSSNDSMIMLPVVGCPRMVVAQGGSGKAVTVTFYILEV